MHYFAKILKQINASIERTIYFTKIHLYWFPEITKARLAISVFRQLLGYARYLWFASLDWMVLLKLALGGYCMVGASNAFNQIIEKDLTL
jgi:heme O synthase-like polyprenyltransferase